MASKDHGLTPIELSSFCSEIALMLGAGMPLYAGMEALEKTYEDDAHAALYRGVSETLTQTGSLRDALESAHAFPTYLVEMCGVGERTGHLEDVMGGLSVYYERESRIRQAVRSAVTYPLVLAVMMVLILLVLILKVMPVFRTVLGSMGVTMTETGSVMMSVGTALGWVVLALVLVFVLAALIPMQQAGVEKSPFVLVFEKVGIPYAADIFNFVILTAILSAANSGLYASGRMLWSLSNEKTLPSCFTKLTRNGVPLTAISVSMLGGVLALFSSVVAPDTVFVALSAISGFAVVAVWLSICASHFMFRRRHLQQGKALSELHYRAPWYPLVPALGFVLCLVACVGLAFDPSQRIALWCGIPFVALCYGAYYLTRSRKLTQEPQHVAE